MKVRRAFSENSMPVALGFAWRTETLSIRDWREEWEFLADSDETRIERFEAELKRRPLSIFRQV